MAEVALLGRHVALPVYNVHRQHPHSVQLDPLFVLALGLAVRQARGASISQVHLVQQSLDVVSEADQHAALHHLDNLDGSQNLSRV